MRNPPPPPNPQLKQARFSNLRPKIPQTLRRNLLQFLEKGFIYIVARQVQLLANTMSHLKHKRGAY
jgi:hypothetical protein